MRKIAILLGLLALLPATSQAVSPRTASYSSETPGALSLDIEGVLFFQDNEFDTPLAKGYTLPGFRLRPALCYKATSNVKIEAGISMLHYWGASLYPEGTYLSIPSYDMEEASKRLHILPFLRVEMATADGWRFILGNIYGGMAHKLPLPLYVPSNQFTADPEAGAQVLYSNDWFDLDAWVDWRTFIYRGSPYQENFYAGICGRLKYDLPNVPLQLYMPLQAIVEHRGGEIDTITVNSVQTMANLNIGLGAKYTTSSDIVRSVAFETNCMRSMQSGTRTWPYKQGWAWWTTLGMQLYNTNWKIGHFYAHRFCNILSSPVFGVASASTPGGVLRNPHTLYAAFDYSKEFAKGYSLGCRAEMFYLCGCDAYTPKLGVHKQSGCASYLLMAYMRINPSFLLKRLR